MLAATFTLADARDLVYLIAIIGFILALKFLSSPKYAAAGEPHRRGGGHLGRGCHLHRARPCATRARTWSWPSWPWSSVQLIAVPVARFVKMTAMPQLVAIFNGVGGGAAALISIVELLHLHSLGLQPAVYVTAEVLLGVLIGSVSFSGSAIAFIKLQELITGRPITYPGQQVINALVGVAIGVCIILALVTGSIAYVWIILVLALVLGVIFVLPIGGADVPVLISLLNSFTGLAVAASGFVLDNAPADRGRHAGRCLGHHPHPAHELGHGALPAQHPLQRLRLGHHRDGWRGGRRLADRCARERPTTSACCWPMPARW